MNRKSTFTRCQTLRLDERTDDLLTIAAYDRNTTKSSIVRAALLHCLGIERSLPQLLRNDK